MLFRHLDVIAFDEDSSDAETLWCTGVVLFCGIRRITESYQKGLSLIQKAAKMSHPDAIWLLRKQPERFLVQINRKLEALVSCLGDTDDARALFILGCFSERPQRWNQNVECLRRSGNMGYLPAIAQLCCCYLPVEERNMWADKAIAAGHVAGLLAQLRFREARNEDDDQLIISSAKQAIQEGWQLGVEVLIDEFMTGRFNLSGEGVYWMVRGVKEEVVDLTTLCGHVSKAVQCYRLSVRFKNGLSSKYVACWGACIYRWFDGKSLFGHRLGDDCVEDISFCVSAYLESMEKVSRKFLPV